MITLGAKNGNFWPPLRPKPESDEERKAAFFFDGASWFCRVLLADAGAAGACRLLLLMPVMLASTGDTGDAGDAGYTF